MQSVLEDIRFALRIMEKSPGVTFVIVILLTIGIGANTAIFTVFDTVLWRMLPVHDPEELVMAIPYKDGQRWGDDRFSYPAFRELSRNQRSLSEMFAAGRHRVLRFGIPGQSSVERPTRLNVWTVSGNYFSALGISPLVGRFFSEEDDRVPGGHPVAVVSYGFWQRCCAGATDVLGKQITVEFTPFTIIGVAPRGFRGTDPADLPDVWVPVHMQPHVELKSGLEEWGWSWLQVFGRLKPGVTATQASAELSSLFARADGPADGPQEVRLESASRGWFSLREAFGQPLKMLMAAVGVFLLIICCNIASLMLARTAQRRHEIGMRLALGCSRTRLFRQLLTESLLLAGIGGVIGIFFAPVASEALASLVGVSHLDFELDWRILTFTTAVVLTTGILFGLVPAIQSVRSSFIPSLQASGRAVGRSQQRMGKALIVSQVALSLVLMFSAGLLARSLVHLRSYDLGFQRNRMLLVEVEMGVKHSEDRPAPEQLFQLQQRLGAIPGVQSVSLSVIPLMSPGGWGNRVSFPDRPADPSHRVRGNAVSPGYFGNLGMRLLAGRDFSGEDTANQPRVVIVNQSMATLYWPGEDAIGKRVSLSPDWDTQRALEIIGVAADAHFDSPRKLPGPAVYLPLLQSPMAPRSVELRVAGDGSSVAIHVRQVLEEAGAFVPEIRTLEQQVDRTIAQERMLTWIFSLLGLLAVSVTAIGIFGTFAYAVVQRTREIGVRMALGASRWKIAKDIVSESMRLAFVGVGIGLPAALACSQWLQSFLFGLEPSDPIALLWAAGLILTVAASASFLPSRRAARVDPMVALRDE